MSSAVESAGSSSPRQRGELGAGPGGDKSAQIIAGAVVGVLGTLLVLATLMSSVDGHYVTRREYEATLVSIRADLAELRVAQRAASRRQPGE